MAASPPSVLVAMGLMAVALALGQVVWWTGRDVDAKVGAISIDPDGRVICPPPEKDSVLRLPITPGWANDLVGSARWTGWWWPLFLLVAGLLAWWDSVPSMVLSGALVLRGVLMVQRMWRFVTVLHALRVTHGLPLTSEWRYKAFTTPDGVRLMVLLLGAEPAWVLPVPHCSTEEGTVRVRGELGTGAVHLVLDDHVLMPRGPAVKVTPEVLDDLRAALTFTLEGYGELPADLPSATDRRNPDNGA